jgi:RNase P/RNase MRP subunit p29
MKKEIIGKTAVICYNNRKVHGIIVDETKNTVVLETDSKTIRILKKNASIMIDKQIIQGKDITKRPEDRIKEC